MADVPAVQSPAELSAEAREFARELVAATDRLARYYAERDKVTLADAAAMAGVGSIDPDWNEQTKHAPADQVTWSALIRLSAADPDAGHTVWRRVLAEASDELTSGNRAAALLEHNDDPLQRARFLVLRATFREDWQPKVGVESALVDMLAQCYVAHEYWLGVLHLRATTEGRDEASKRKVDGYWLTPRVPENDAIEQAATMVDRFNRLFLRTLRSLRDLRRYSSPVTIQNAGQVNVGGQQVNVSASGS